MNSNQNDQQSSHDAAVFAAAELYFDFGMYCRIKANCLNNCPGEELNIDVFAAGNLDSENGWGIAFETYGSISGNQAQNYWLKYSEAFDRWYLAVPINTEKNTAQLLEQYDINNCSLITWQKEENEMYFFWGLPGLPSGPHKKRSMYNRIPSRKKTSSGNDNKP